MLNSKLPIMLFIIRHVLFLGDDPLVTWKPEEGLEILNLEMSPDNVKGLRNWQNWPAAWIQSGKNSGNSGISSLF